MRSSLPVSTPLLQETNSLFDQTTKRSSTLCVVEDVSVVVKSMTWIFLKRTTDL